MLLFITLTSWQICAQTPVMQVNNMDLETLNQFILNEVNVLRRKESVEPLRNNAYLESAAQDHADYMLKKEKLTHVQRFNKRKKTPKNRVDFYGRQFAVVGENVQLKNLRFGASPSDKKNPPITTYEQLAKELVASWKNSPGHYRNMVNPEFAFTYVAVAVNAEGEAYACQLFGGTIYEEKYEQQADSLKYRAENARRCRFCQGRTPLGTVVITPDSSIQFVFMTRLRRPTYSGSRMRLFNPWNDGLAANIVLKSQFPCDSSNFKNGRRGVTGIPLPPVYKKDFRIGVFRTVVNLGKVPSYIREDFEVNVTIVKNKRTCREMVFHVIPSSYHVDIPLTFGVESKEIEEEGYVHDTLTASLFFHKAQIDPVDTSILHSISEFVMLNKHNIRSISLEGYASIEGSTESNALLYTNRAKYLKDYLSRHGIDEKLILTTVTENFADFREDVEETEYAYLAAYSDSKLKDAMKDQALVKKLEPFLAKHRYVQVNIITKDTVELEITKEFVQQLFTQALATKNRRAATQLQRVQYGLILQGKMSLDDLDKIEIPAHKRYKLLLHNHAVIHFLVDTLNKKRYDELENRLTEVKMIDSTFKRVRTSLAILEYYRFQKNGSLGMPHKKYYKKLVRMPYVDKKIQARIILNFASSKDYWLKPKRRYYNKVKGYVAAARLDVDKTFELASYYSYFDENDYAYNLVKSKIDNTENPADLVYFLKLIHLTDVTLPRDKYLGYFKKILKYSDQYCTFFNSPNLNFQILNDPDVKEIYCQKCAGVLNTETRKPDGAK